MTKTEKKLLNKEIEISRSIRRKYREFQKLARKELDKLGGLKKVQASPELFKRFKNSIPRLFRRAGLDDMINDIAPQLKNIERISMNDLATALNRNVGELTGKLKLRKGMLTQVNKSNGQIITDQMKRTNQLLTQKSFKKLNSLNEFKTLIKQIGSRSRSQMESVVSTSVQGYDNVVTTQKANELGVTKFRYAGVDDSINRPFCADRVGKIFTDAQAEKWDNKQGLPADEYLGGYRCRHRKEYIVEE